MFETLRAVQEKKYVSFLSIRYIVNFYYRRAERGVCRLRVTLRCIYL